jgi:hypothetical protein
MTSRKLLAEIKELRLDREVIRRNDLAFRQGATASVS